jgi:alpha-L-fucosidase
MLTDIVSKNGNLLINIVLTPEGDLDPDILQTVKDIGRWTAINGEGIYGSRPWKVYGEKSPRTSGVKSGSFNESKVIYDSQDIRFTTRGNVLYAFCLDRPQKDIRIASLGSHSAVNRAAIASVSLLGDDQHTHWKQHSDSLIIRKPSAIPLDAVPVLGFKIEFKD